jgi:hypothetical protein
VARRRKRPGQDSVDVEAHALISSFEERVQRLAPDERSELDELLDSLDAETAARVLRLLVAFSRDS